MYKSILNKIRQFIKLKLIKSKNTNLKLGEKVRIDWKTDIRSGDNLLKIGDNVYLRSNPIGYHAGMPFPTTILIDRENAECWIGDNCRINGSTSIPK